MAGSRLCVLEQEGQVVYLPRRGYFVTELRIEDLTEIYELRRLLEARAARKALPMLDEDALLRILEPAEQPQAIRAMHTTMLS